MNLARECPTPCHAPGEPCPVIDLAVSAYGLEGGMALLWEETCFPFDDDHAMVQLQEIIATRGT
jgi:hypothetical protein